MKLAFQILLGCAVAAVAAGLLVLLASWMAEKLS